MVKRLYAVICIALILSLLFYSNTFAGKNNATKLISSNSEEVKITINNQESSVILSFDEANKLKDKFLKIEEDFEGIRKINEQINLLKEIDVIPSNFNLDTFSSVFSDDKNLGVANVFPRLFKFSIGLPLIVSHLTIGGRIECFYSRAPTNMNPELIPLNGLLENFSLNTTRGYLRAYGGFAFLPVYVTAIGPRLMNSYKGSYLFFIELLIPCVGFSIGFDYSNNNSKPVHLFEYNLDACLFGIFAGI